jgi:hypothetical protein
MKFLTKLWQSRKAPIVGLDNLSRGVVRTTDNGITRIKNRRVCDPTKSFLERHEHWWVFDWNNQVNFPPAAHQDVYSDRHFVMYNQNRKEGTPALVFGQQVLPANPIAPAKLRGSVHLMTPDQIRELDEAMMVDVQSIRTRMRLVFPNFVQEIHKDSTIPTIPTIMHAWMYFHRSTPEMMDHFKMDYGHFRGRKDAEFLPAPVVRHEKEFIRGYYAPRHDRAHKPNIRFCAMDLTRLGRETRHEEQLAEMALADKNKNKNEVYVVASSLSKVS